MPPWSPVEAGPEPGPPTRSQRFWWRFVEHYLTNASLVLMIALLIITVLYPFTVVTVPSGQVGVLWRRFAGGTVLNSDRLMGEGMHFLLPWDIVFLYDLRLQSINDSFVAISKDGVSIQAAMTVRFRLNRDSVPLLHEAVGQDYLRLLMIPEIANRMREVIANYTAEQVYSSERPNIQEEILARTQARLSAEQHLGNGGLGYVTLYDTLLLRLDLPPAVVAAIERKINEYYLSEAYDFRVQRERKEALRKQIEASGIRDFQATVGAGITDSYLRLRGIEATVQLAQSPNSKMVIMGGGKDGIPVILNNVDLPGPMRSANTAGNTDAPGTGAGLSLPNPESEAAPKTASRGPRPPGQGQGSKSWLASVLSVVAPVMEKLYSRYIEGVAPPNPAEQ